MLELEIERTVICAGRITALTSLTREPGIVVATSDVVTLWTNDGCQRACVKTYNGSVVAVHALPSAVKADAVIGNDDGTVSIVGSFQAPHSVRALAGRHPTPVRGVASLSLGGAWLIASVSQDGTLMTRDPASGEYTILAGPQTADTTAFCTAIDDDLRIIVTGAEDGTVTIWYEVGSRARSEAVELGLEVTALCVYLQRGRAWIAAGTAAGHVIAWDLLLPDRRVVIGYENFASIVGLAWLTDAAFPVLAAIDATGTLRLWSMSNEACVGCSRMGNHGVGVVEPMGRPAIVAVCDSSWTTINVDLDRYVLDLESQGSGA